MSYDIRIAATATATASKTLPHEQVRSFLSGLAGMRPNGKRHFVFEEGERLRMELDLEFVDEEGTALDDTNTINRIALHIPYAFLGDAPGRDYFPIARTIAEQFGWVATDAQTDKTL